MSPSILQYQLPRQNTNVEVLLKLSLLRITILLHENNTEDGPWIHSYLVFGNELLLDDLKTVDVLVEVILADCEVYRVRIVIGNFVVSSVMVGHVI